MAEKRTVATTAINRIVLLAFLLMAFHIAGCRAREPVMKLEEARRIALDFHGETLDVPPRGFGKKLQFLVDVYQEDAEVSDCEQFRPEPTPAYIKSVGRAKHGHFLLQERARHEYFIGNIDMAIKYAEAAAGRAPWNFSRAECQYDLARFIAESGDFIKAQQALARAEQTRTLALGQARSGQKKQWAIKRKYLAANCEAAVRFAMGDMAGAEAYSRLTLHYIQEIRKPGYHQDYSRQAHLVADAKLDIARAILWQGRLIEAETWARSALDHHNYIALPKIFTMLGLIFFEQGRIDDAEILLQTSVNMLTANRLASLDCVPQSSLLRARTRELIARCGLARGRYQQALEQYGAIEAEMVKSPETYRRLFEGNRDRGFALLMAGKTQAAIGQFSAALTKLNHRWGDEHFEVYEMKALLAIAAAMEGRPDEAVAELNSLIPRILTSRHDQGSEGTTFHAQLSRLAYIVEQYLALLFHQGHPEGAIRAFEAASTLQGRTVGKALSSHSSRAASGDQELARLIRERQDLEMNIAAQQNRLTSIFLGPGSLDQRKLIETLRMETNRLKAALTALQSEIEEKFPEYSAITGNAVVPLAAVRKRLKPDEAVISFFIGSQASYTWAFRGSGPVVFKRLSIQQAELDAQIATLREALEPGQVNTLAQVPAYDLELAHRLYQTLLRPTKSGWRPARRIYVIANRPLDQLPLSLLPVTKPRPDRHAKVYFKQYQNVDWLVRHKAVAMLPSVMALYNLRTHLADRAIGRAFAGFGDPIFASGSPDRSSPETAEGLAARGQLARRARPMTRGLTSADLSRLPRLPETAQEVLKIAAELGADPVKDVFIGLRASEATIKSLDLSDRRILVFATHGLLPGDLDGLNQPALALTSPRLADDQDNDGLLTMGEIMWLRLNADWVVLSACNTASGQRKGAEAVSGLGQAFFYAGAKSLLATGWPVETHSAMLLTTDLFRRQVKNPELGRAEALRQAKVALIDGPGGQGFVYAHPLFWAPFILFGEGG